MKGPGGCSLENQRPNDRTFFKNFIAWLQKGPPVNGGPTGTE